MSKVILSHDDLLFIAALLVFWLGKASINTFINTIEKNEM